MGKEYERAFMEFFLPKLTLLKTEMIDQTYLVPGDIEEIRVRKTVQSFPESKTSFEQTLKYRPEDEELPTPIRLENTYLALIGNKTPLEKRRDTYSWGNYHLEVDTYINPSLLGIVKLEIEFPTKEEKDAFLPPPWFGKEVTGVKKYKNKNLWLSLQR